MDPYASGVLDPEVHGRLVADLERIAAEAGIQAHWISRPLAQTCKPDEVAWARRYRFHAAGERAGLVLVGRPPNPDPESRMAALAGALTRNFIACRVMTLHALLAHAGHGELPEVSCLLVPNFFVGKAAGTGNGGGQGGGASAWRVQGLLDALLARQVAGRQTVLYVSDVVAMGLEYGEALRRHVEQRFDVVDAR